MTQHSSASTESSHQAFTPIPLSQRQMSSWDLFATWIGANANNGTWYIGGVIAACGLVTASITLIIVGLLSYILLALASYMGYRSGLPAMALTRASFGLRGSYLPSLVNLLQFIGWAAVNTFIAATSISYILDQLFGLPQYGKPGGQLGLVLGILIMSVLHLVSISLGEKSVRLIERIGIILVIIFFLWESIVIFQRVTLTDIINWQPPHHLRLSAGVAADTLAAFNLAWVTSAADFSRFTKHRQAATSASFFGANLGLFWFAFIGIFSTIAASVTLNHFDPNDSDPSTVATKLGLGGLALIVIILTSTTANAVNLFAAGSALKNIWHQLSLRISLWIVTVLATLVTFIPLYVASFLTTFETFLDAIGMLLGPEIAIFLIDYFVIHHRYYQTECFSDHQGPYWYFHGINGRAVISWLLGVACYLALKQIPQLVATTGTTFITIAITAGIYYCSMILFKPLNNK
ncbi:cytosine permease [Lactiplantibacillus mudanjiangensis]|uniref:Purine-cytosine permease related protein [Lactobacillus brevis ATCC 367] n=1 Tax=Lactiplantibacillus mudanjiangensis TaxID=1296538 RepID=A0A660DVC0_9LACO|nr:cytosine permease [Lactiplantibacillus mudanjiangensis]VDG27265.1 Purine-cytosine permease related protein [Lactobacillus brevis ATCC 367] [Lactiplantibacillus mudanjiangensis]